jgi:P22_AR N-terminal domain
MKKRTASRKPAKAKKLAKPSEVALVPFKVCGQEFTVLLDDAGEEHVKVSELAEKAGLGRVSQQERVSGARWARCRKIRHRGSDGKEREFLCIPVKKTVMFYATLEPSRASAEFRPILERFQDEISDAVHDYIANGGAVRPSASTEQLRRLSDHIGELLRDRPAEDAIWRPGFVARYAKWHGLKWSPGERHPASMRSANHFFYQMIFEPEVYDVVREQAFEWICKYHQTIKDKPRDYVRTQLETAEKIAEECDTEKSWRTRMRRWYKKTKADLARQTYLPI